MLVGIALVILLEIVGLFLFNGILNIPVDRIYAAKIIYQFMILNMFLTIVSVPYKAIINSHENMLAISIINILESIGKLIIALLIIRYTRDRLILYGFLLSVLTFLVFISMRQVSLLPCGWCYQYAFFFKHCNGCFNTAVSFFLFRSKKS